MQKLLCALGTKKTVGLVWFLLHFKNTSVLLQERGIFKRNDISNFKSVNLLTTFPKVLELVTKNVIDASMKKYLSSFASAYQLYCSAEYDLVMFIQKLVEGLDKSCSRRCPHELI